MALNKRVSGRLQSTIEERQLQTRDVILLIVFMVIVISAIAFAAMVNPGAAFENVLLVFFLSAYTTLLFTISYVFSDGPRIKVQLFSVGSGITSAAAGFVCLLTPFRDIFTIYRVAAFFSLAVFCFGSTIYARKKTAIKARWYVAVQPAALFVLLFVFFNIIRNSGTEAVWAPYLMDVYGLTFAVLIILYLSSLFTWKTVGLFAVLLTAMDIILVIGTPAMVTAASSFTSLGLPVLVWLPNIPLIFSSTGQILFRGLGLGDFFFAGILCVQTLNKFGRKTAFIAAVAMALAFGIWEAYLLNILAWLDPIVGRNIGGFPGTVMIISGWAPVIGWKVLSERRKAAKMPVAKQPLETPKEQSNLPIQ
ncbi:MAG TPA: hypothetical protein VK536_10155 [Candidatus Limnocylindrales bacterium]|nr:hypothetical protein [Candidatus Limnocylindrales bacterium]